MITEEAMETRESLRFWTTVTGKRYYTIAADGLDEGRDCRDFQVLAATVARLEADIARAESVSVQSVRLSYAWGTTRPAEVESWFRA